MVKGRLPARRGRETEKQWKVSTHALEVWGRRETIKALTTSLF